MDVKEILKRIRAGKTVTPAEYAYALSQDRELFFSFLIANNPGSMNDILRHKLGYSFELDFMPDVKAITRLCQIILDRNNKAEIKTIVDNFQLNTSAISPELLAQLQSVFNTPVIQ